MKKLIYILFLFCISFYGQDTIVLSDSDIAAVPFAKGFGRGATGGRGGTNVWKVTNLNTSGPGSYDEALRGEGGGYVVFDVGGVIRHTGDDYTFIGGSDSNKTIEYATAPAEGIEIQGAELRIQGSNIIARNGRIRLGPTGSADTNVDCINISTFNGAINNIFLDRMSLYYPLDEAFSTVGSFSSNAGITNVSFTNSIIAHAHYGSLTFKESYGISHVGNISAHNNDRDFYSSVHTTSREVINNIVYDPGETFNVTAGETHDLIGNHFILRQQVMLGLSASSVYIRHAVNTFNSPDQTLADSEIYANDNIIEQVDYLGSPSPITEFASNYTDNDRATRNFTIGNFTTPYPASSVIDSVLSTTRGAGAMPWNRDAIDQAVIDDIANRTNPNGKISSPSYANNSHFANPASSSRPAGFDTDDDGLPDTYETLNGNPVSTDRFEYMTLPDGTVIDQSGVTAGIRYTYIEGYFFDINNDWDKFPRSGSAPSTPLNGKGIKSSTLRINGGNTVIKSN